MAVNRQGAKVKSRDERFVDSTVRRESNIEYVPFERKVMDYKTEQRVERVPRTRTVTDYREEKREELIPR